MASYKHFCIHCDKLIPGDSNVCPICGKRNPFSLRCPKCSNPIQKGWKACSSCGLKLETVCPKCQKPTFFGDYCESCDSPLTVVCPNPKCRTEQPPVRDMCIKCGKPLK